MVEVHLVIKKGIEMKRDIVARFTYHSFVFLTSFFLLCVVGGPANAQWTQFRGPNGSGVDSSTGYPVEFSPTKNMAWKTSIPFGQSSPVVVGARLFGTASEGERLITFCLDTRTGRELWRRD